MKCEIVLPIVIYKTNEKITHCLILHVQGEVAEVPSSTNTTKPWYTSVIQHLLDTHESDDKVWENCLHETAKTLAAETEAKLKELADKKRLVFPH